MLLSTLLKEQNINQVLLSKSFGVCLTQRPRIYLSQRPRFKKNIYKKFLA